jgi:hypothetical protein
MAWRCLFVNFFFIRLHGPQRCSPWALQKNFCSGAMRSKRWPRALDSGRPQFCSRPSSDSSTLLKPHEDWIDPISVALYGVFWCLTLRRTGSLWFAVGFHAASDYADMVVFAEPNSGNDGKPIPGHLLDLRFHGPGSLVVRAARRPV